MREGNVYFMYPGAIFAGPKRGWPTPGCSIFIHSEGRSSP